MYKQITHDDKLLQEKITGVSIFFHRLPESKMTEIFYDYSKLDQTEVLQIIFHPRRDAHPGPPPDNVVDNIITVDDNNL